MIDVVSKIVGFTRSMSFTVGNFTFTLWEIILVLGVTDGISFIFGLKFKSNNYDDD